MTPDEFYDITPSDFNLKLEGFYEAENDRERREYERQRWVIINIINCWIEKPIKKATDLVVFEWEKTETKKPVVKLSEAMTPEARERLERAFDKF